MIPSWETSGAGEKLPEATYARYRRPDRIYVSRSFPLGLETSRDYGQPARFIYKVFDERAVAPLVESASDDLEVSEVILQSTPAGRKQIKLMVVREAGNVRQIEIQRVPPNADARRLDVLLKLDREGAAKLIGLVRELDKVSADREERRVRMDPDLLDDLSQDPDALAEVYDRDPGVFRALIEEDSAADDVVAIAHRRAVVARFRELLLDPDAFETARREHGGSRERVWQRFFEEHSWILGASAPGQLVTSWNEEQLEQVVAGYSVASRGKRVDALLRTNGQVRSMVFAEIKHHETPLLEEREYRPGCWGASKELSGGVTQIQQTVYSAVGQIGDRLPDLDDSGAETGEWTFLVRPRSFLIVGQLRQLRGENGVHIPRFRCFELYRRNLYEPEIVTFDELLARAEWFVQTSSARLGGG